MTSGSEPVAPPVPGAPAPGRRLRRAERREQILAAATRAFARAGFAATSLDDIARHAGITKVLIYRHFDSKADLYQAVLDDYSARLQEAVGDLDQLGRDSLGALVAAAAADPDAFRLLFHHVAREPDFRAYADEFRAGMTDVAERNLRPYVRDPSQRQWAAELLPVVAIEATIAWLDTGQPKHDSVVPTIQAMVDGVLAAISADG